MFTKISLTILESQKKRKGKDWKKEKGEGLEERRVVFFLS